MKSNAAARRLLGMNHWRSNTQQMQYVSWHVAARTGKPAPGWIAVRTRSSDFCYFTD
ncbi:stationary-phase-induced ribosome-associated protein [Enterobacter soli]|uniref:stationary-phase-induced ribosome-associated protein n=1 Tax=Enterobacter TaxID=547 RepID=UPI000A9320DF|nr:stationary-phase-induced ribosome-associated protein [Enterobacter hormaechei]HDR2345732.1 stationary-phase-induced ribosome-associated protein [Enterobacter kobei]EKV8793058.1 stationary-phase-induced ribosome-associated protein [Enterobacter hormaechei]ELD4170077.1 stationary-phase-induced ribosome-associated protein [Enterobacter hormaechei]MCF3452764.1 stationary-phase-induced ribosome-associated protein [Enterobacter hormaechei]MDR9922920.1 stationary-phase-induced ribosome-associated 